MTDDHKLSIKAKNLEIMFNPRSIAVVGASRKPGSIGRAILKNLIDGDFAGALYPVNPNARSISSIKCYKDLKSIEEEIDLVFIVVPANYVLSVIQDAVKLKIKSAVIISAGFKEIGGKGIEMENKIIKIAGSINMRLVGPNCMGIINTYGPSLNATFAPNRPIKGKIGFISQSGALGVVVLDYAQSRGLGFSKFVSLGNQADINANDMIENLGEDENTDVILAYLESFSDPWNFVEIATKTSKKKPIVIVKSGRTPQGAKAASSHTGALATMETTLTAILSSSGVIRVASVQELFDCAAAFSKLKLPRGKNVCIISNAGGPGTILVDALISQGLEIAQFSEKTEKFLFDYLPIEASSTNPIDLLAAGGPEDYNQVLDICLRDKNVNSIIALFVPPLMSNILEVARTIDKYAKKNDKPILGVLMGKNKLMEQFNFSFPMYKFPEAAARALKALTEYARWKYQDELKFETFSVSDKVKNIIPKAKSEGKENLSPIEVFDLLTGYGFRFARAELISTHKELMQGIIKIGYPAVLKIASTKIEHKTDFDGVVLNIKDENELNYAFNNLKEVYNELLIQEDQQQMLLQKYYEGGVEMALGVIVDPQFGPILMIGSGGILVEILDDIRFEKVPVTREQVKVMIKDLKGYPLLIGYRGGYPVDMNLLEEAVLRLSQLANENRDIVELDINPLLSLEQGETPRILDARIKIKLD